MHAAILAVGSELLSTERLDTNSLRLTAALDRYGVELRKKSVVGDSETDLAAELRALLARVDLVLVTGGLGPTADDITRPAVAAALGRGIHSDPEVLALLEERFRSFARRMPEVNRRQAEVIDGAVVLANALGTAPGLRLDALAGGSAGEGATIFLFPGVPHELEGMIADHLAPWLAERSGGIARESVTLKIAGLPESEVEERIAPAYDEFGRESITILAGGGEIKLIATAAGPAGERAARLTAMADRLATLAGDAVYTRNAEDTLEKVVGDLLRQESATLATAESCTGGLLAERLTRLPGSSDYFLGGVVTYSNAQKTRLLGVPAELLAEHGAVSEPVARAMAEGVCRALGSGYGAGITGVAGPGGGSEAKPVGTVHLAVAGPGGRVAHRRFRFPGDRERVRWFASQLALEMLRRLLLGTAGTVGSLWR
ncbi:MAG TPA: competence/damage-inducible protein A [Thermoanaerobaculia bacterium]|nr:competence/damage-inducible protein A [Thermoanaerobaculia bacterium]